MEDVDGGWSGWTGKDGITIPKYELRLNGAWMTEADIGFNPNVTWTRERYRSALMHELGHSLGIAHSYDSGAVMWPSYLGPVSMLAPDDIAAIQSIYAPKLTDDVFEPNDTFATAADVLCTST